MLPSSAFRQTEQYLRITPKYNILLVPLPIMIPTPDLTLYEYWWECLLQPPSTIIVMAGIPW